MDTSQVDAIIVAQFFVSKGLSPEVEASIKLIMKCLGIEVED